MTANQAILSLFKRFSTDCKRLLSNDRELEELSQAYFRYRDLLAEQKQLQMRIVRIFGVLGVHAPDVSSNTARLISPAGEINSAEVRKELKLWEVLALFLSAADDRASIGEFRSFLLRLGCHVPTPQAIDSAIKSHPELFKVSLEGRDKVITLIS